MNELFFSKFILFYLIIILVIVALVKQENLFKLQDTIYLSLM